MCGVSRVFSVASTSKSSVWKMIVRATLGSRANCGDVGVDEYDAETLIESIRSINTDLGLAEAGRVVIYIETDRDLGCELIADVTDELISIKGKVDRLVVIANTNSEKWDALHKAVNDTQDWLFVQKLAGISSDEFVAAVGSMLLNRDKPVRYLASYLKYVVAGRKHGFEGMCTFSWEQQDRKLEDYI